MSGVTESSPSPVSGRIDSVRIEPKGDLASPNPDYFARMDTMVEIAARHGITLLLDPAETGSFRDLLRENGVDPRNILLLTFTNKAARQMLDRVANLLPTDASGLWGGTFHSIGNRMLRRLNRLRLDHLAMVPDPAYAGASVLSVRSAAVTPQEPLSAGVTPNLDRLADEALRARFDEINRRWPQ